MRAESREAFREAFVAGFLFFVLVLSAGHAMALDGGSASGSGTITQTVNPNAPRLIAFDIRNGANTSSVVGNQVDVLTGLNFWMRVNNTNGWASLTKLWINLWYDAGSDSTAFNSASKDPTTGNFYEFGVYQYTSISLATLTWTGASGAPGQTVLTNSIVVTHSSNAAYWVNVTAGGDLSDGSGHTIGSANVKVVHNAGSDDLSANTAFPGTAPRTVRLLGAGANIPHAFDSAGDSETVPVQFQIAIPLGTFAATYTASITVLVDQRKPPTA